MSKEDTLDKTTQPPRPLSTVERAARLLIDAASSAPLPA
ncbi:chromosome partitioning protein ParA, partial [Rhodospirillum rubrum]|nr:chromosome partitioning protein ParA [Rhodospirillum rubrum]